MIENNLGFLFLFGFGFMVLGYFLCVLLVAGKMADHRIATKQEIEEALEEIIQEAIDNITCWHKAENDAEYTLNDEGTAKIQKILEGL